MDIVIRSFLKPCFTPSSSSCLDGRYRTVPVLTFGISSLVLPACHFTDNLCPRIGHGAVCTFF